MLNVIIGALATWRATHLLMYEDGPYDLLVHFRDAAGIQYDERSKAYADTELGQALLCVWCCSLWVGCIVALFSRRRDWPLSGFAYSAVTILMERVFNGSR